MTRLHFALAGVLAAVAGMSTGHLVAAFIDSVKEVVPPPACLSGRAELTESM